MKNNKNVHELFKLIPVTLPMTHRLVGPGNVEITGVSQYPIKRWEELQKPKMTASMWYKLVLIVASAHKEEIDEEQANELAKLISLCDKGAHMNPGEQVYLGEEMGIDRWEESVKPPEITYKVRCETMEDYEKDMKAGKLSLVEDQLHHLHLDHRPQRWRAQYRVQCRQFPV